MTSIDLLYNQFFYKPYNGCQHTYASEPTSSTNNMLTPDHVGTLQSICQSSTSYPSNELPVCSAPCYTDSSPAASSISSSCSSFNSSLDDFCVGDVLDAQPQQQYLLSSSFTNTNDSYYAQPYSIQQPQQYHSDQQEQQQVSPLSEYWISPMTPLMESMNGYMTIIDQQQTVYMKQEEEDNYILMPPSSSLSSFTYESNPNKQQVVTSTKKKSKKIHRCPHCQHTSNRANNMKEHILTHNPYRPKLFACDTCQKTFARKHDMKRHVKSHSRVPRRQKK
ncbi:hypothetical protein BC941DRAFT_515029 [Chlamydoabsidia padenii]|nr:hypothetical protein BC941DRAFT_515029 [Chlamydoabsidia padenii]